MVLQLMVLAVDAELAREQALQPRGFVRSYAYAGLLIRPAWD